MDDRLPLRIQRQIIPEPNSGCWIWTGPMHSSGYGKTSVGRALQISSHRLVYTFLKGKIPKGLQIDHLCRVILCCNPEHLEAVTPRENLRRSNAWSGKKMRQTHCKNGHALAGANLILSKKGHRRCRVCENAYQRKCNHKYDRSRNPK